jgi:hypothetical protein
MNKIFITIKNKKVMKKLILQTTAILLILAGVVSCGKEEKDVETIQIKDLAFVVCQNTIQSNTEQTNDTEHIKCYAINETTLRFEQHIYLNCCLESLRVTATKENNTFTINELDDDNDCNCICSSSVSFNIPDLKENNVYTFIFQYNSQDYYQCEVRFDKNCNLIFNL